MKKIFSLKSKLLVSLLAVALVVGVGTTIAYLQAVSYTHLLPSKQWAGGSSPSGRTKHVVAMAQLASAPDCGSGGRGFESH